MVYFEYAFRWCLFYHNLKMHGPSCKNVVLVCCVYDLYLEADICDVQYEELAGILISHDTMCFIVQTK
jgi:hypothetical protein